jgi:Cu/Ag efflux pump CusA
VKLPSGYRVAWAGEFEDLQLANERLAIAVPVSLILILVILLSLFNSFRDSLLALAGVPFAMGRDRCALRIRSGFERVCHDRLRVAVRRVDHGRHPDDHLFQSGPTSRHGTA